MTTLMTAPYGIAPRRARLCAVHATPSAHRCPVPQGDLRKPLTVDVKAPKPKIVIYAEGEKTERDYFDAMRRACRSVVVDIEIIEAAGVPLTIAKEATQAAQSSRRRNRHQSYARHDEFWVVFDRDQHPNIPQAISRCNDVNVGVAFSDPCFELWFNPPL